LFLPYDETIYLTINAEYEDDMYFHDNDYIIGDWEGIILNEHNELLLARPKLDIKKSADEDAHIIIHSSARGRSRSQARDRARNTKYDYYVEDESIIFEPWIRLAEGSKWRKQEIALTVEIPVGQRIYCDHDLSGILDYDSWGMPYNMTGKTWIMTDDGLEKEENSQQSSLKSKPSWKKNLMHILVSNPQF